jgi:DnaK suppressor protein
MSKKQISESLEKAKIESSTLFNLKMDERYERELEMIDQALGRIEDGTFGICRVCGRQILLTRLETIPETTLCRECAFRLETA